MPSPDIIAVVAAICAGTVALIAVPAWWSRRGLARLERAFETTVGPGVQALHSVTFGALEPCVSGAGVAEEDAGLRVQFGVRPRALLVPWPCVIAATAREEGAGLVLVGLRLAPGALPGVLLRMTPQTLAALPRLTALCERGVGPAA